MNLKNLIMWVIIVLLSVGLFNMFQDPNKINSERSSLPFSNFLNEVEAGRVVEVQIQGNNISGILADGKTFKTYTVYHPIVEKLFETDEKLPSYVTTSHKIDPYFRVKMQGVIQKYIDSSISSTVNLANEVTIETVADIYMTAYKSNLKGITVYREGSREGILITNDKKDKNEKNLKKSITKELSNNASTTNRDARKRPNQTSGVTRRIRTGEGTLYITINEDENGLCEVFTTIGKAGGNAAAQSEAISRLPPQPSYQWLVTLDR